jgi:ribonucleoside-diphosphate reductase alpha chain
MVIGHDRISMATSIIDYLFRELAVTYLGRDELAHFGPPADHEPVADNAHEALEAPTQMTMADVIAFDAGDADTEVVAAVASTATAAPAAPVMSTATTTVTATKLEVRVESKQSKVAEARLKGYEGDPCDECGQLMMVRNGTCLKCLNCGATSGCS